MAAVKIMYLLDEFEGLRAGTEGQLMQLLDHIDRSRFEPALTFLRHSAYTRKHDFAYPVRVLDITSLASLRALARMCRFAFELRRTGYRLVHIYFNDASIIAPFFLRLAGIRVLVSRRDMGFWYTSGNLKALRLVAKFVDRYIANSAMVKSNVCLQERVDPEKVTVIYNGYASKAAEPDIGSTPEPGVPEPGAMVIGLVANLRPIKRIDLLITAFSKVLSRFPNARLVIVGDKDSIQASATYLQLKELAAQLGVQDRIMFTGQVSTPMAYIKRFDIAVLCSDSEGFSNSVVEYMQAGKPVVCTRTGGNPEIVQDGVNGYLVPIGDSEALARRISALLADDKLATRLGAAGLEVVKAFTHTRMVAAHMQSYDDLLMN